jgi:hypothetical protein
LLAWLLGEAFLGFLAIVATALTLFPMLFRVGPRTAVALETIQWFIIGWFGFEYAFALATARAKRAFLLSPWRLLDLVTVLIPLATLLPSVSNVLRSSPALRLVRLVRLVTLGVRASGVAMRHRLPRETNVSRAGPAQVTRVAVAAPEISPKPASWDELLAWVKAPTEGWYHIAHPSLPELAQLARAARLPEGFLATHLVGTGYPHWVEGPTFAGLFVWLPEVSSTGEIRRHGVLLVASAQSLLSLARDSSHVIERMEATPVVAGENELPLAARMLSGVLEHVIRRNEALVGSFEQELRALEDIPVRESSPGFFERTFRLKKELSAAQADLWRFKAVLAELADGRRRLPGVKSPESEDLKRLALTADYLYETLVNLREEVLSVLELHLNVVSFDMNRVMRVLAVVSVLGLIPAVIGGLFGMNLADNPWPFTLPQVAFSISFGMVLCFYFFFVKGWLR